jgi:AcrR family transcriptional regulator
VHGPVRALQRQERQNGEVRLGKQALLDAADVLIDEHGVDAVSLNEITRVSGHRNRSAANYHFGSRDAVLKALFQRGMAPINDERNQLLDRIEEGGAALTLRSALEAVVAPLAARLHSPEGRRYLRLSGQLYGHPVFFSEIHQARGINSSLQRCARVIGESMSHLPPSIISERGNLLTGIVIRAFADHARRLDGPNQVRESLDPDEFTVTLVDVLEAMVTAPNNVPDHKE